MAATKRRRQPWGFFAPNLILWRRYRVLSQIELAEKSGVSNSFVAHMEAGRKRAAPETIQRLATALGITREQLIRDQPPE